MPRVVDKTKKRKQIAAAALQTFRELGYHRTRMADVARAGGIGKGTVYEYFSDKADILGYLFDDYFVAFKSGALRALENRSSPGARLFALVHFAFDHLEEWRDHCAVYVEYFGAARAAEGKPVPLDRIYDDMGNLLSRLIAQAQQSGEVDPDLDPGTSAELLLSIFDGIILHGLFAGRRQTPEELRETALRVLASGLGARPAPARSAPPGEAG